MAEERLRIARAVHAYRPDWTVESLDSFIRLHLKNHTYREVRVAFAVIVDEPAARGPEYVLNPKGPWWKLVGELGGTTPPAIRHPQCALHKGCLAHEDHPVGADRCPDCNSTLVKDVATAKSFAEMVRAEIPAHRRGRASLAVAPLAAARPPAEHLDDTRNRIDRQGGRP